MKGLINMYNYNNGSSVPAKELSSKELKKAINAWSEGDKDLKNLLFTSYKLDLETSSCCAGSPYISYYLDDKKQINNIKKMLQLFRDEDDIQILITPDGGNPFSGKNWYRPFITFSKKYTQNKHESIFKILNDYILKDSFTDDDFISAIIKIADLFSGKESDISIRLSKSFGQYVFELEYDTSHPFCNMYSKMLKQTDIYTINYSKINSILSYGIIEDDYIIFGKKLQIIAKKLEKVVANIPLVDDPNSPLAWNTAAIMKRKFGDLPDGKKQFEDWLQKEQDLFFSKIQD